MTSLAWSSATASLVKSSGGHTTSSGATSAGSQATAYVTNTHRCDCGQWPCFLFWLRFQFRTNERKTKHALHTKHARHSSSVSLFPLSFGARTAAESFSEIFLCFLPCCLPLPLCPWARTLSTPPACSHWGSCYQAPLSVVCMFGSMRYWRLSLLC